MLRAMTTAERQPLRRPQLPVLTSLRFFAAAEVLAFHFGRMNGVDVVSHYFGPDFTRFPASLANNLTSAGHEAVTFFFVLSGFVLTYVYAGASERQGFAVRAADFWWARFARLAPGFYLGLLLALPFLFYGVFLVHSMTLPSIVPGLVLAPVLLQSWWPPAVYTWNFPSWSLSVEAFFYLLFPLLAVAAARLTPRQLLLLAVALLVALTPVRAAILTHYATEPDPANTFGIYFPPLSLPQFILGIALGRLFLWGPALSPRAHAALFWFGLVAVIVAFGWQSDLPQGLKWLRTETGSVGLLFGMVIFGAAGLSPSTPILASPILVFLGDASYLMYILHIPLDLWWKSISTKLLHLSLPPLLDSLTTFLLVVAVASLVHAYVEPPLRRRLLRRRPTPLASASSSTGSIV
jgi:peptidoglycan/LPS O-acetylase OafA/YrhL